MAQCGDDEQTQSAYFGEGIHNPEGLICSPEEETGENGPFNV
jgi:hypothetical protein